MTLSSSFFETDCVYLPLYIRKYRIILFYPNRVRIKYKGLLSGRVVVEHGRR